MPKITADLYLNTDPAKAAINSFAKSASSINLNQPLGKITGQASEFTKSLEAATARVTAFGATAGAIYKVSQAIREGAKATIEIDKQLVELNTFLGKSRSELEGFSQSLFKIARNAAVPFEAASEAAKEFARQGLSANEILKRTEDALTLARISGISYAQAVNGITTAINSFSKEALSTTDIVNKLIAVDTRFAVSSAQLNEALTRVGSSAEESGISLDKLIATVTAAQQITGRGGAVIGNALKTIFTRLQRPEVLSQLEQLGVAVKDQNGFLLDGLSILKNYSDATKNLSQTEKARTAELVGGIYQINQVNALIKDLSSSNSVYASALKISSSATDEAKKKNEELNKSLSAVLQQTKTRAQEAASALGQPLLEPIIRLGSTITESLLKVVNPNSELLNKSEQAGAGVGTAIAKGAASALGKVLVTAGLPIVAGIGAVLAAKIGKFGYSSVKDLARGTGDLYQSDKSLENQKRVNDILRLTPGLVNAVKNGKLSLADAEKEILRIIKEQNLSLLTQARIISSVAPAIKSRGGVRKIFAEGYIPELAMEEAQAKALGASNPKARIIQATIGGKTGQVVVNNQERIIPNFAGTGNTAIIPNYAKGNLSSLLKLIGLGKDKTSFANLIGVGAELAASNAITSVLDQLAESELIPTGISRGVGIAGPALLGGRNIAKGIFGKGSTGQRVGAVLSGTAQAVGGGLFANSFANDLEKRINQKKYEEALDKSRKSFQDLTENTTELSSTLSKLDAAYRDPKADPSQIAKLATTREDLIKKVSTTNPELVAKLASEETLSGKISIIEENQKESQRRQDIKEQALSFSSRGALSGKEAPAQISSFFSSILNRANSDILNQDLSKATPANFAEVLKKGGLNIEELSNVFNTDELKKSFIDAIRVAQERAAIISNEEQALARVSRPFNQRRQLVSDAKEIRGEVKKALEEQLPELASFAGSFSKRAGISASSDAALALKKSEASVSFQNSLLAQLADKNFTNGLSPVVISKLNRIETPGAEAAAQLESIKSLPELSREQVAGIEKLIGFNSQQARSIEKATIIANETKNIQIRFLALQEKLAFGGDIKTSINAQMRGESMAAGIRGPLTYQLGGLFGSRRTQVGGATDFITETMQKYPGLLQTKGGKEPADIKALKAELTGLNAMDMQRDLLKRAGMAGMMGMGQTAGLLRSKAFDQKYLLESAGLKASALFGSPEVPEEIQKAMGDFEKFGVQSARASRSEDAALKVVEQAMMPLKQQIVDQATAQGNALVNTFEASLKSTFGDKGITATVVNIATSKINPSDSNKAIENISKAYSGMGGGLPVPNFANPVNDAVTREKIALGKRGIMGVPNFAMASINLERSPDLVSFSNPQGFGVTNSIDEKNGLRSLGMRSSGYVPNYALFGDKVASAGLSAAKAGNLFVYDHGAEGFYRVTASGRVGSELIGRESLPKGAKTISTQPYSQNTASGQLRGSNILKITDPRINKLDELKVSTIPKSQRLDPILNKLSRAGKLTPENLLSAINKISGGEPTLVKTAFGSSFAQGKGVFGRGGGVGLGDADEIIKRFQSGDARGLFAQAAVDGPHYGEMRVHVAVDANGRVKLLKGGSILKIGAGAADITSKEGIGALSKSGLGKEAGKVAQEYKKAAQATAVRSIRELVAKKGLKNAFFGVDVGATTLESARKAGVNTKEFYSGGRGRVGTVVFELNPSESLGSSGYIRGSTTQKLVDQVLGNEIRTMPEGFAPKGTLASKKAADISTSLLSKEAATVSAVKPSARARDAMGRFTSNAGVGKNALKLLSKYGGKALGGLGAATSIYGYYEGFQEAKRDKYAGAAKMFESTGGLALVGAGLAGAGLATTLALPLAVGALGYGAIKGVEATGLLDAMYGLGPETLGLGSIGSKATRGLTSREAVEENRIVPRKMELLREINKYNEVAGNPLVSETFQLSRSREAQMNKNVQDAQEQQDIIDKQNQAAKAAASARAYIQAAMETGRIDKEMSAQNASQSSSLRRSFLESFSQNAESAGYLTTRDKVNYLLDQEGKNGMGEFQPSDFGSDVDLFRSYVNYKKERQSVPNFAAMSNSMMSSGDVYSRMRSSSPASSMGSYSGGSVPNFAAGEFTNAIAEAMKNGITSAFPNGGSSSSVSNSNVINIDGRTSIQNAPDEAMQGIISILFDKIPELKKLGPAALNFKR
jgi:TP901 family phage tail tape measure protein